MSDVAKRYKDKLPQFKKNVESACLSFKDNAKRFHKTKRFVFKTNLDGTDETTLKAMGKPLIQFNISNAYISRLCGEFSKQEPSIEVRADQGTKVDPRVIEVVEGHIRHILDVAKRENVQYLAYRDQLTGGYSILKVCTDYANDMSFDQIIKIVRPSDPTVCGFDPMAKLPDKSDADFYFELFPMLKSTFKELHPDIDLNSLNTSLNIDGFKWIDTSKSEDVITLCDYYTVKKKRTKIVKTANDKVMTEDDYNKFVQEWMDAGYTAQPPAIVGKPRWTVIKNICRYQFIGSEVVEYEETDFKYNNFVFMDGDSELLKEEEEGSAISQFTKPYIYHAQGIQRFMNFAGQTWAADIEDMVMHKFKVAIESLPDQGPALEAYSDVQKARVLLYNAFMPDNPDKALPPPMEVARVPIPAEVPNAFLQAPQIMQHILGSYDAALGINNNELSGVAIVEGATQSNAAAMPYVVSHMQALNQIANIIVDLIPKYYVTPRTIPVIDGKGKRSYQRINDPNDPNSISFNYDENALQVKVEAGVNFAIAQNRALQQILSLMQADPQFSAFMQAEGLEVLLDNVQFRGSDILKEKAVEWQQKVKQAQENQQNQPNPQIMMAQIKQQEMMLKTEKSKMDAQLEMMNQRLKQMDMELREKESNIRAMIDINRSNTELKVHEIDAAKAHHEAIVKTHDQTLKHEDQAHRHAKDILEMQHKSKMKEEPSQ